MINPVKLFLLSIIKECGLWADELDVSRRNVIAIYYTPLPTTKWLADFRLYGDTMGVFIPGSVLISATFAVADPGLKQKLTEILEDLKRRYENVCSASR